MSTRASDLFAPSAVRRMVRDYRDGYALADLAYLNSAAIDTVRRVLVEQGVAVRNQGRPPVLSDRERRKIATAYRKGQRTVDLSEEWGVSEQTIRRILHDLEVPLRGRGG